MKSTAVTGKTKAGSMAVILIVGLYLVLPLAVTFLYSVFREWDGVLPKGFTLGYYLQIFGDSEFLAAIGRTVVISILPILICALAIMLVMYVVIVYAPWLEKWMQLLCTVPYAIQGVIIAISVLAIYADAPAPFSNRVMMLTGTYCVIILPYMYQGIRNSMNGVNAPMLLEAAQMLGSGRLRAFFKVVVPNTISGIVVSSMLSASIIFGDFVIINTLGGNYFPTAQVYLFDVMKKSGQNSSAVIVVLFLVTLLLSLAVFWIRGGKQRTEKRLSRLRNVQGAE